MKTKVVFRYWRGNVIALFPEIPSDAMGLYCQSYEHVGQHGGADYQGIIRRSRPATKNEYQDLAHELRQVGYKLTVVNRCTYAMREARYNEVDRLMRRKTP